MFEEEGAYYMHIPVSYTHLEGMWMLPDLQKQNAVAMPELGLLIPTNQIYNPDGIALKLSLIHI